GAPVRCAWGPLLAIAAAMAAVLLAFGGRYGFHRDELYFLVASRHLDWGYADQPPLLPLIMRLFSGESVVAVRVPAALLSAAGVVVAGLSAREMGGGRRAQALAAGAYAVCPFALGVGHTLYTATVDMFVSTVLVWVVVRWVRTRDDRLLLALGAVVAVAVQVKYLVVFLLFGILAGVLVSGPREALRRPMLWAGAAVAVAAAVPGLVWQAHAGWPQLAMAGVIAGYGDFGGRLGFFPYQLLMTGVVLSALWIYGLWRLTRSAELRPFRFLAWAYVLVCVVFLVTGGKTYYLAGFWAALWAAGAVEVERREGLPLWVTSRVSYAITAVVAVLVTLPVYPVEWLARTPQPLLNPDTAETVGWPRLAGQVAAVRRTLPAGEHVTLMTANYGEAGALELYGRRLGLPRPYSGHTGYWYFGRPAVDGGTTIFVGAPDKQYLDRFWSDVTLATRVDNGVGLDNIEQGAPIWVCRGQRAPWSELWPRFKYPA
ncbi:glycosyltransferase family 39 protein, partial [Nonomuraea rhizosphaerae]|uniref:glycosyltransferase family 39 protein n=1 Tax=Nonomuraea rhizosphaerae TaxID=2665663 RepID=UPI001C5E5ED9